MRSLRGIPLVIKMAANISVRELPSPEKVLTSLKSSGTFDRFRKSCMASIELDVSSWEVKVVCKC